MDSSPPPEPDLVDEVDLKITQLQSQGLTLKDQVVLEDRLPLLWGESRPLASATRSRRSRARRFYKRIQDASNHLFLAVLLVIPPTVCIRPDVQVMLNKLTNLHTYDNYQFQLGLGAKRFFESTAAEQGFAGNPLYLTFMQSIFPEQEARRELIYNVQLDYKLICCKEIQFAYSLVARENIRAFLDDMLQGMVHSKQWTDEGKQGGSTSGCVTIIIPRNQNQDGSCTIRVDRTILIQTIHKFNLTKLKLE